MSYLLLLHTCTRALLIFTPLFILLQKTPDLSLNQRNSVLLLCDVSNVSVAGEFNIIKKRKYTWILFSLWVCLLHSRAWCTWQSSQHYMNQLGIQSWYLGTLNLFVDTLLITVANRLQYLNLLHVPVPVKGSRCYMYTKSIYHIDNFLHKLVILYYISMVFSHGAKSSVLGFWEILRFLRKIQIRIYFPKVCFPNLTNIFFFKI